MEADAVIEKLPDLALADLRFCLSLPNYPNKDQIQQQIKEAIEKDNMTGFHSFLMSEPHLGWKSLPADVLARMEKANAEKLAQLESTLEDAIANLGETEVREALLAKADFFCRTGQKELAIPAYQETLAKTVALGQKLDIHFTLVRLGFFTNDSELVRRHIKKAHVLMEEGSDWDRRNRLKTYEAIQAMQARKFSKASSLFVETLSTFSSFEIFDFETYVFYTVFCSMLALDRVPLKEKIIDSPEVLSVIEKIPHLSSFLNSFYKGEYQTFFSSLLHIMDRTNTDRVLNAHTRWFCREMRVKAYAQFLESYRSVQLESMAKQFGVSSQFLDEELSRFIAIHRLNCKIDKVSGIVETNRPDSKNAQYAATIKQGDLLLNRVQKLAARVINL